MIRWMPLAVLLLAGCASAPPTAEPATPAPTAAKPTVKGVEPVPPTNIGDGSAIEFTMLHGLRKGQGKLEAKPTVALEVADVALEADGTFRVAFSAVGGATKTVAGTWRKRDGKTVDLTADRLDDAKVGPVAGRMEFMDRANPSRIEIGGEDKTSDGLRLKFDVKE